MPPDILMLTNVVWHIKEDTKRSLLLYADDCRVILKVGNDFKNFMCDGNDCGRYYDGTEYPLCDEYRERTINKECLYISAPDKTKHASIINNIYSDSFYVLDDDDVLLMTPEDVPDGYDGIIYDAMYGDIRLGDINIYSLGTFFGYARCVLKKEWYLKSYERACDIGLQSCFDVFYLADLYKNGRYLRRNDLLCNIDITPRTMHNLKFRKGYAISINKIQKYLREDERKNTRNNSKNKM